MTAEKQSHKKLLWQKIKQQKVNFMEYFLKGPIKIVLFFFL